MGNGTYIRARTHTHTYTNTHTHREPTRGYPLIFVKTGEQITFAYNYADILVQHTHTVIMLDTQLLNTLNTLRTN